MHIYFILIMVGAWDPIEYPSHVKYFAYLKFFFRFYLFIFRERAREVEREGEKHRCVRERLPLACPQLGTWPATQACALTGNRTRDLLVLRLVLNPLNHTSQGDNLNTFYNLK